MTRTFKTADYEKTLDKQISIREALSANHLAYFVVDVVSQLDLSALYGRYGPLGAPAYAPEVMLGLLFYGYATGVFSSRKMERATYEVLPFRFIAGDMHPDHDTIAAFRKENLAELQDLFVQILLMAQTLGYLQLGNVSLDGSKIHADASKSKAMSYRRLLAVEAYLQQEVEELFALAAAADAGVLAPGLDVADEIARRQERLARLAEARQVLEARARAHDEVERAAYEAKLREREEKAAKKGQKPRGRKPKPPTPGPRDKDQYNFTDPESRIMKNATNKGIDQHFNVQVVVEHESRLIVGACLSNEPNDKQLALPTIDSVPMEIGKPESANLDTGYFSQDNVAGLEARQIEPYIATGRHPHQPSWRTFFAAEPTPPTVHASATEKMAYKLRTDIGNAIYRLRKSTVEPVIGIIKEILGFRQFSLRGLTNAAGEWTLVCLAYNLKRMHVLKTA
jgi:transposase